MRNTLILAAAVIITAASFTPASAARRRQTQTYGPAPYNYPQSGYQQSYSRNVGFFGRLMELERRKNAAIGRMLGVR